MSFSLQDLSAGTHTIRLVVRDRGGLWSEGIITTLVVNGRPRAAIDTISPSASNQGEEVRFEGSYSDHEDDVTTLVWESDVDGMLSSMEAFTTCRLSNGTHNITFRVKDACHAFRRSWAVRKIMEGVPLWWILMLGGWEDIKSLDGYVRAADSRDILTAMSRQENGGSRRQGRARRSLRW